MSEVRLSPGQSIIVSVLANIFLFDVISIKCWIRTIRKDFVKMSINVFDVSYA